VVSKVDGTFLALSASGWPLSPSTATISYVHVGRRVTRHASRRSAGYTIIELVVVITILGVIAAIAGPRFFNTTPFNQRGYADEVASAIRYAQKIAVGSGCSVQLSIDLSGYTAMQQAASGNRCNPASASWTTPVRRLDGALLAGTPPSDANVNTSSTLVFNNRGAVISGATNFIVGGYTLALDAATGFVTVQ
jgi:MSHA pilin protein MshC